MDNSCEKFTLSKLPLPAKLVVTVFLMAVGLGYCWAMMQLHFKHAGKGSLLPGVNDVVERFSGQAVPWEKDDAAVANPNPAKKADAAPAQEVAGAKIKSIINARCVTCHGPDGEKSEIPMTNFKEIAKLLDTPPANGKFFKVISKDNEDNFNKENMSQAFTKKSTVKVDGAELEWKDFLKAHKDLEPMVRIERDNERIAVKLWIEYCAPEEAYENDAFPVGEEIGRKLTKEFRTRAKEMPKPTDADANMARKRNPKDRQLNVESLTQSTHAHLLTFAVLWAATGLVFAFTSYPCWMRIGIAPIVLVAQVADIACWWLARLPDVGPYFAVAIMGTGAVVGLGLTAQIILSLFNMYGSKGKAVLLVLMLVGAAGGGLVYTKYIAPEIAAEKSA